MSPRRPKLPPWLATERESLTETVNEVRPVFVQADSTVELVDETLRKADGGSILHPRCTRATVHPRPFGEPHAIDALLDATSRVFDWTADAAPDLLGERHAYLVPLAPGTPAPDENQRFLVVEGRPEVVQIVRRCLTRALARGAGSA